MMKRLKAWLSGLVICCLLMSLSPHGTYLVHAGPAVNKQKISGMGHIVYATHTWYNIDYQATIKLMDALGVKRWRNWMHTKWLLADPHTLNQANAKRMKAYIQEAQSYEIEIMGMNHNWFNGSNDSTAVPNRDLTPGSEYMKFLRDWENSWKTIVSHFPEVAYWQIGNEWDNDVFLHPLNYNDGEHVFTMDEKVSIALDMMYYGSKGIHAANPNAITVMGGLSMVGGFTAMRDFLSLMYAKMGSGDYPSMNSDDYFQVLAWHPYTNKEPDAAWLAENDRVYDIAVKNGDGHKKVFFTEFGFSDWHNPDLDTKMGDWIKKAYELAASHMDYVETIFLFRLMDETQSSWGSPNEKYFGLFTDLDHGFSPKNKAFQYQAFAGGTGDLREFESKPAVEQYKASAGFSLQEQGPRWFYERRSGGIYNELSSIYEPWNSWRYASTSLAVGSSWQAPHESGDAVRTWVAPREGDINISSDSSISLSNDGDNADGVKLYIKHNDTLLWPKADGALLTYGNPIEAPELMVAVKEGDKIRFIVNIHKNSWYDTVMWDPVIRYLPAEPAPISIPDQQPTIEFKDLNEVHWAYPAITEGAKLGIWSGYPDGTIRPDAQINRAEFAVMLNRALSQENDSERADLQAFKDMQAFPEWAVDGIERVVRSGLMVGNVNGMFNPYGLLTRAELAVVVARAAKLPKTDIKYTSFRDDLQIPAWAKSSVQACVDAGMMRGDGQGLYMPNKAASRAEVMTTLLNLLEHMELLKLDAKEAND